MSTAGNYASSNDKRLHFVGSDSTVRLVEITWASGSVQRLENVAVDQVLTVKEPA